MSPASRRDNWVSVKEPGRNADFASNLRDVVIHGAGEPLHSRVGAEPPRLGVGIDLSCSEQAISTRKSSDIRLGDVKKLAGAASTV